MSGATGGRPMLTMELDPRMDSEPATNRMIQSRLTSSPPNSPSEPIRPGGRRMTVVGIVAEVREADENNHALRPRQLDAAALLVSGMLGKDVAQVVGVTEEAICRWKRRADFRRR